ncbi:16S rRNA (guanine(527)-N(7))-methyltransferase RsmG [Propionibacteriaceae bacterium G1746]|uniref:16S rRNA (guanine(527)-N(7))-methyltransferase RsmG n=1 Tax=Aestuariimicrobium sp. G57 TaxID=3418485 RepID=UPI003C1E4619
MSTGEVVADDSAARQVAERVYGERFETISQYVDILTSRGIEWGLLGPREPERIWTRHILNSAAMESLLPRGASVMDLGSGAGLPGLPLAILRPDLRVVLVESLQRRATFLQLAVDELGLSDRVDVVRGRAEETRLAVDVVACRAVAPLDKLVRWSAGHFLPDGQLMALKGDRAEQDLADAAVELKRRKLRGEVLTVRADQLADPTQVVVVRRAV